jgi:hypothetical protein
MEPRLEPICSTESEKKIGRHDIVSREETMIRLPEES